MNKKDLREKYLNLRKKISNDEVDNLSLLIANNLLKLKIWNFSYYHLFLPIEEKKEVNTEFIIQILAGKDKDIIISKSDFEKRKMTNYLLTDNTKIRKNKYNIPEPIDGIEVPTNKIEVVFIPLLAYDKTGHRVGYGKGFYDIFLQDCRKDIIKVGLSFFETEEIISDVTELDIQLDYCVTPNQIIEFAD